jgi:uncharacterized membrane protein YgcG
MQLRYFLPALFLTLLTVTVKAQDQSDQDSTGLPGDNFSLQGALEMFKQSSSPEAFEKALNSEDNKVNNLDLNGDGNIDYIKVINKKDGDVQVFILQAVVSEKESQDIAVISLQKTAEDNAVIQIEGDKDIYGEAKIAEPAPEADNAFNYSPATHGPSASSPDGIIVNVWFWPCVRFVYAPAYVVWVSPWTWYSRPVWWRPWRPMPWHYYHPYYYRYNTRYIVVNTRRIAPARVMYRPYRTSSVTVINRNRVVVNNYRATRGPRTYNGNNYQPSRVTNGSNPGGRTYQPSRVNNGNQGGRTYQPSRVGNGNTGGRTYQPSRSSGSGGRTYNNSGGRSNGSRSSSRAGRSRN